MSLKGGGSGNEETRWEAGIAALMKDDIAKMLVVLVNLEANAWI